MFASASLGWWKGAERKADTERETGFTISRGASLLGERQAIPLGTTSIMRAPLKSLPEKLRKALERSDTNASYEVQLLMARWFEEDREALRDWALKQYPPPLNFLARLWLREDPESIWLDARHTSRQHWNRAVLSMLAEEDPKRFFESLEGEHLTDGVYGFKTMLAARNLAKRDFAEAEATIKAMTSRSAQAYVGLAMEKASQAAFEEAFSWASNLDPPSEVAVVTVIDSLATSDPEEALRLLYQSGIEGKPPYQALTNINAYTRGLPLEQSLSLLQRYPLPFSLHLSYEDLPTDPMEAATLMAPLNEMDRSPNLHLWMPDIPLAEMGETLTDLSSNTEERVQKALFEQSFFVLSSEHPEVVFDWIANQEDPVSRSRYAALALRKGSDDPDSSMTFPNLLNLIQPGDLEEVSHLSSSVSRRLSQSMQQLTYQDPHSAIALASQFQDPAWRQAAYKQITNVWIKYDEAAVSDWIASLPSTERSALMEKLPQRWQALITN